MIGKKLNMRKYILVALIILVFGCHSNTVEKPTNLIDKDKMTDILYDISLLEAVKNQNINGGITSKIANQFIYKKYKIDSIQFVKSNTYYASDIEEYKKMFEKIKARLNTEIQKNDAVLRKSGQVVLPNQNSPQNSDIPQVH